MLSGFVLCFLIAFFLAALSGKLAIPILRRIGIGQNILSYVSEHKKKQGTPTMGGIIFIIPAVVAYFISFGFDSAYGNFAGLIFIVFALIGFADDLIKVRFEKNEGLLPWQKMIFLFAAALVATVFLYLRNATVDYIPFTTKRLEFGWLFIPLSVFTFLATSNCVNLTDGLDGLAASVSAVYFLFNAILIVFEVKFFADNYVGGGEILRIAALSLCVTAALIGFLIYNVNVATVFMGDTGSLALGGIAAYTMAASGNLLYIPLLGITFVVSGVSVILQVLHFKRTKKRIFLMAPLHHHFQHKGYSETKIVFCYVSVTIIMGLICLLAYVGGINVF
ncbi:MAG: phospho-N-acetylmuramoyl-pentapeptide-transferase [Clostridia bacterium]|nr:phospho-N-acetylmuramoyl-pentapeptide-transferase [Clostridia bacterium]